MRLLNTMIHLAGFWVAGFVFNLPAFAQQFITPRNATPGPAVNSAGFPIYGGAESAGLIAFVQPIQGVADFNRDGKADILTTYNPNGTFSGGGKPNFAILLSNGDGTFTRHVLSNVVYPPNLSAFFSAKIADVNGDGTPDLVIINGSGETSNYDPTGPSTLYVYIGQGDGTFRALSPQLISSTLDGAILVATDLNRDGKADLVVETYDDGASIQNFFVLLNNGTGVFHPGPAFPGGSRGGMTAADLNGDGHVELILDGQILNNDGTGKFTIGPSIPQGQLTAVGDVNRDGRKDLFISQGGPLFPTGTRVLLNQGDGTFRQSAMLPPDTFSGYVLDVNHDGFPDYVAGALAGEAVFIGKGDGTFSFPTVYSLGFGAAIADFTGNGNFGALTTESLPFLLTLADAHGYFDAPRVTNTTQYPATPVSIVSGDFNGDKKPDIAVLNSPRCYTTGPGAGYPQICPQGTVALTLGTGLGYMQFPKYLPIGVPTGVMAAGDVNGDGKMDIVITRATNNQPVQTTPVPYDTSVLLGNGDGTFKPAKSYHLLGYPGFNQTLAFDAAIYLIDVNLDGKLDLVGDWGVALGKGDGSFQAPIPLPKGLETIYGIVAGDFNRDGKPDLVVTTTQISGTSSICTLLGDGKGSFTIAHTVPFTATGFPQSGISAIATADLNHDGILDLIYTGGVYNYATNTSGPSGLYVQLGRGDGTFSPAARYSGVALGFTIMTGDFNRDGLVDVLVNASALEGDLVLFKGVGNGLLSTTPEWYSSGAINNIGISILAVNLDGNTALDVAGLVNNGFARVINTGKH